MVNGTIYKYYSDTVLYIFKRKLERKESDTLFYKIYRRSGEFSRKNIKNINKK